MWVRARQKPFAVWVIAGGLVYVALAVLVLALPFAIAGGILAQGGVLLIVSPFVAVFLVAAAFVLREKRWAYVLGAAGSIVFFILNIPYLVASGSNPADAYFWISWSVVPALVLIVLFSVLGFRYAKTGLSSRRYLATPHSTGGLLTLAVIGFVVGSLVVGAIAAAVIQGLLSRAEADINIVPGALSAAIPFDPQTFTVSVGTTVTWLNKDTMTHTVTSNDTGLFGSALLTTGNTFSHTFSTAGTYYYHCDPHPQMWGKIVVTP